MAKPKYNWQDGMNIQWDEKYSIGDKELDRQHQRWIHLYNRLETLMRSPGGRRLREEKSRILKEMSEYVAYHFRSEEEYMRRMDYPEVEKHWRIHKNFHDRVYRLYRDHNDGSLVLNSEILEVLKRWIVDHITECDQKIAEHIGKQALKK